MIKKLHFAALYVGIFSENLPEAPQEQVTSEG